MATDYYNHSTLSPIDDELDCQDSYVIIIGDGDFFDDINVPKGHLEELAAKEKPIKTFIVAYGGGISEDGLAKFETLADAGGTEDVILASTPDQLLVQLRAKLTEIIADKLSFTTITLVAAAPSVTILCSVKFNFIPSAILSSLTKTKSSIFS